ncbi:FkbM family methyltransferase [Bradyrhizobium sp.]|uniref:FkbM family methyltransferase n=1 Tax=Bradyrhizobium sp. TaxID=376 RepID=UPI003C4E8B5F
MVLEAFRTLRGISRSLRTYYGNRARAVAMDRLYRGFVQRGDLVFDIGAHVGDRVASFRRLGARIVAVEPQPAIVKVLRLFYGRRADVAIEAAAVARLEGMTCMMINSENPTISTASSAFIEAASDAPGWQNQHWRTSVSVPVTTLDALIGKHGTPAFIKIDVEGFEEEALLGLSRPVKALSFEFTTIQRQIAIACVERCVALGYRRFNAALGESQAFVHANWVDSEDIARWLAALPHAANSGDIYAALV